MYENYKFLKFEYRGKSLLVTMDNPPLNTAHLELHNELSQVFYDVEHDDACDLVVLTGAGKAFSAGGDLQGMLKACDDPKLSAAMITRTPHIVRSMLAMSKPVIARVNGHAMGMGATLVLLADVAFMVEYAKFADPHVNIGLSAGDGGALLWPQMIGYARARHYLLTGDAMTGTDAAAMGLIHKAVPAEQLNDAVWAYADRLLALPAMALRTTKRSINTVLRQQAEAVIDGHAGLEHLTIASHDHREALQAFLDKRAPVFCGA